MKPVRTTICPSCGQVVGAHHDEFSNDRTIMTKAIVWKTRTHKYEGVKCPGSRLSVPAREVALA